MSHREFPFFVRLCHLLLSQKFLPSLEFLVCPTKESGGGDRGSNTASCSSACRLHINFRRLNIHCAHARACIIQVFIVGCAFVEYNLTYSISLITITQLICQFFGKFVQNEIFIPNRSKVSSELQKGASKSWKVVHMYSYK